MSKKTKIILSLDVGKYDTKAIGRDTNGTTKDIKKLCFRTKKYDMDNGYVDIEGNSYRVKFDNKEYIIGEQGEERSYDTSKTNILHKLSAYTAITEYLEPDTESNEIYLVLACPLSVLQIQEAKEEYKNFIKDDGEISIEVNDKKYTFEIKDVTIKAEGSGILYLEPELFQNKNVAIVDLGGLNFGFTLYRNSVCQKEDRFIEELGSNYLIDITAQKLTKYKNGNIVSDEQAEQALEKGYLPNMGQMDSKSAEAIIEAKEEYLNKILDRIRRHAYKIEELDSVIFVGGTTQKIKEQIAKTLSHSYIPTNAQTSTAEGLYKVAFAKYRD